MDKELKQGPVKADIAEPLSQYELSSYPSAFNVFDLSFCVLHVDRSEKSNSKGELLPFQMENFFPTVEKSWAIAAATFVHF